jgi:hypothetical protein
VSEEELSADEEKELERIADVYLAAAKFSEFLMKNMENGKMGIACNDEQLVLEFAQKLAVLVKHLTGSDDVPEFKLELGSEDDSSSGGSEPDSWEAGGELRPGNRKLH